MPDCIILFEKVLYCINLILLHYDAPDVLLFQELMGISARGDYDLRQHASAGGKAFEYNDIEGKRKYIPHVIEPSFGLDR